MNIAYRSLSDRAARALCSRNLRHWTVFLLLLPLPLNAQKQEIGLTLGGFTSVDRISTTATQFNVGSGLTLQAGYEYRILKPGPIAFYVGLHLLASPQRQVTSSNRILTRDIASLYLIPNIMVKVFPHSRIVPWATIGGGYGDYEQSTTVLSGALNGAPRELARGVLMYGGGVDVPVWRFVALRAEVRDFYSGNAAYNVPLSGSQHNVTAAGGLVLRFGGK